jgi:virginiamycin B lyase
VWTSNIADGSVSRIDAGTNKVVATIPVWPTNVCGPEASTACSSPVSIATTPGAVWVVLHHEWAVVRIDPATNKVVATVPIGSGAPEDGPQGITASNGMVYVGGNDPSTGKLFLKRIDPATNAVTPVVEIPAVRGCDEKAADETHVWFAVDGCESNSISAIDTSSGSIVGRVDIGGPAFGVSIGLGAVWVVTGSNELVRIDPATHSITGRLSFPAGSGGWMSAGEGAVWLAVQNRVYRIEQ